MSSTLLRRRLAGHALTGVAAVVLLGLGLKLAGDDLLRAQLGSTLTPICFLVLILALGGLAMKTGIQVSRWKG